MINLTELLPVGSVVLLKDGEKRLMISGVLQSEADKPDSMYDYCGVFYPEGHIGDEFQYLFNHEDITQVFYRGFEDEEREEFIRKLDEFYRENQPE